MESLHDLVERTCSTIYQFDLENSLVLRFSRGLINHFESLRINNSVNKRFDVIGTTGLTFLASSVYMQGTKICSSRACSVHLLKSYRKK